MFRSLGEQLRKPSGAFGQLVSKMMDARNREFYENIIRDLDLQAGDKIFEIGFGTGLGIELIANHPSVLGVGCSIDGIDLSELMVQNATKRNQMLIDQGLVHLQCGDFFTAVFDDESYDKIFCVNVIYFWSNLYKIFKKIHSMLNQDGLFCLFMIPDKEIAHQRFAEEFFKHPIGKVESELEKAGFKNIEYRLDKGYYIKAKK
ncbi:MAG TPA: class I SAM-dependent methyltransferase [Prolixibacteraceae bacterium]|jgi:predicted TPR repeat methyltransferase